MSADELPAREAMEFDVVIVGAGPAGLAAAIRLKQLSPDVTVVVVEKSSEVGAHILSGAVIDPVGLDRLLPDWRGEETPIKTKVSADRFYWLSASRALRLPNFMLPPLMNNHGNYVVSLGDVCRWLATKAEASGVEIYPGFAAGEVLFDASGAVSGIVTGDMGVARDGHHKDSFTRGMELRAKYTLFAEGARGSLTKVLEQRFGLNRRNSASASRSCGKSPRKSITPVWCSIRLVGRSTTALAVARFSIILATGSFRSASCCISTTKIRTSRRTRNFSASRRIR